VARIFAVEAIVAEYGSGNGTADTIFKSHYYYCFFADIYLPAGRGKNFSPMAYTLSFALVASMLFSLTFVPSMLTYMLGPKIAERHMA